MLQDPLAAVSAPQMGGAEPVDSFPELLIGQAEIFQKVCIVTIWEFLIVLVDQVHRFFTGVAKVLPIGRWANDLIVVARKPG